MNKLINMSQRIKYLWCVISSASMFFLLVVIVTLSLAVWQVQRGLQALSFASESAVNMAAVAPDLHLSGRWQYINALLDNRTRAGVPGFWVLDILTTDFDRAYLVVRGFLASSARDHTLMIPQLASSMPVSLVPMPWPKIFYWGQAQPEQRAHGLRLLQRLEHNDFLSDFPKLESQLYRLSVPDAPLLDLTQSTTLSRTVEGDTHNVQFQRLLAKKPHKHFGYALQWFGFSVAAFFFAVRMRDKVLYE